MSASVARAVVGIVERAARAIVSSGEPNVVAESLGDVDRSSPDVTPALVLVRSPAAGSAGWSRLEVIAAADGTSAFVVLTLLPGLRVEELAAGLGPGRSVPGPYGRSWRWDVTAGGTPVAVFAELEPDGTVGVLTIRRDA